MSINKTTSKLLELRPLGFLAATGTLIFAGTVLFISAFFMTIILTLSFIGELFFSNNTKK